MDRSPGADLIQETPGPPTRAPAPPPATVDGAAAPVAAPFAGPLRASARTTRGAAPGRATPRSLEHLRAAGRRSLEYLRLRLRCERLRAAGRRSQRENGAADGLACFEVAVRLLHMAQPIALLDADFDLPAGHHGKQVVGHGLCAGARGNVGEQRLARDVQRAFGSQQAR